MDSALHSGNGNCSHSSDDELPRVANGGRLRKMRNFRIGNFGGIGKFVRESAEAGTQNKRNLRPVSGLRKNEVSRSPRALVLAVR